MPVSLVKPVRASWTVALCGSLVHDKEWALHDVRLAYPNVPASKLAVTAVVPGAQGYAHWTITIYS